MTNRILVAPMCGLLLWSVGFSSVRGDEVDDLIAARIRERHLVGLSLAIIDEGKIVKEQGYGFTEKGGKTPVTPATLFQAGSVSKSVAALGALQLVEKEKLSLDVDVNSQLRSWKVPENQFTKDKKVTLRAILSHSAGLTVHGFPGYAAGSPVPTLLQVLNGVKPANTPPIRVDIVPGSTWRYSGGGYTVMQQLMIDVTGKPFPEFMHETVLKPLAMTNSTYAQPLPPKLASLAASGHYANGKPVAGRAHVYPEMAAAGLWTTAADLARFAIGIQHAQAGTATPVISQKMTQQMLTVQKGDDGLGVFLQGRDKTLRFFHNGRDEGFDALLTAYASTGKGVVIMINTNDDAGTMQEIVQAIAKQYHW